MHYAKPPHVHDPDWRSLSVNPVDLDREKVPASRVLQALVAPWSSQAQLRTLRAERARRDALERQRSGEAPDRHPDQRQGSSRLFGGGGSRARTAAHVNDDCGDGYGRKNHRQGGERVASAALPTPRISDYGRIDSPERTVVLMSMRRQW